MYLDSNPNPHGGSMIIKYKRMHSLIGDKRIARAMDGMYIAGGVEGFIAKHDSFIAKAKQCRENNNTEGETKCYRMATALRMYFDSNAPSPNKYAGRYY
jgi:hypothetical protein